MIVIWGSFSYIENSASNDYHCFYVSGRLTGTCSIARTYIKTRPETVSRSGLASDLTPRHVSWATGAFLSAFSVCFRAFRVISWGFFWQFFKDCLVFSPCLWGVSGHFSGVFCPFIGSANLRTVSGICEN